MYRGYDSYASDDRRHQTPPPPRDPHNQVGGVGRNRGSLKDRGQPPHRAAAHRPPPPTMGASPTRGTHHPPPPPAAQETGRGRGGEGRAHPATGTPRRASRPVRRRRPRRQNGTARPGRGGQAAGGTQPSLTGGDKARRQRGLAAPGGEGGGDTAAGGALCQTVWAGRRGENSVNARNLDLVGMRAGGNKKKNEKQGGGGEGGGRSGRDQRERPIEKRERMKAS